MKNTNYVMNFLEGIGLDVKIEYDVVGKEGYTHEGNKASLTMAAPTSPPFSAAT